MPATTSLGERGAENAVDDADDGAVDGLEHIFPHRSRDPLQRIARGFAQRVPIPVEKKRDEHREAQLQQPLAQTLAHREQQVLRGIKELLQECGHLLSARREPLPVSVELLARDRQILEPFGRPRGALLEPSPHRVDDFGCILAEVRGQQHDRGDDQRSEDDRHDQRRQRPTLLQHPPQAHVQGPRGHHDHHREQQRSDERLQHEEAADDEQDDDSGARVVFELASHGGS